MANRSYLVCCDFPEACPRFRWKPFDAELHVVAQDSYAIPLLWLAMFRVEDLVSTTISNDDKTNWTDTSPVTTVAAAWKQLTEATIILNEMFANHGPLDSYADLVRQLLDDAPGSHVSIDLEEIAYLSEPAEFAKTLRSGLKLFSNALDRIGTDWPAPLPSIPPLEPAPQLRGRAAVDFLVNKTRQDRKMVDRVLQNCGGDINKALTFFQWQSTETTMGPSGPPALSSWSPLAELSTLRFGRRFPIVSDVLLSGFQHCDDEWNFSRLVGGSYIRPVPW